jgi:hypothetical protein
MSDIPIKLRVDKRDIDELLAENAKLREDLAFQGAITEALLPYQTEAVALREVLREYVERYPPRIISKERWRARDARARALLEGK